MGLVCLRGARQCTRLESGAVERTAIGNQQPVAWAIGRPISMDVVVISMVVVVFFRVGILQQMLLPHAR
jgi:hypothetical protein